MQIISPHLARPVAATWHDIADLIPRLLEGAGSYAVIAEDELTYAQVQWVDGGFILEHQAGSTDRHFRAKRRDFQVQDIVGVLSAYCGRSPGWSHGIEFERIAVRRPVSFRLGHALGQAAGIFF